jgi:hypothetical protein
VPLPEYSLEPTVATYGKFYGALVGYWGLPEYSLEPSLATYGKFYAALIVG